MESESLFVHPRVGGLAVSPLLFPLVAGFSLSLTRGSIVGFGQSELLYRILSGLHTDLGILDQVASGLQAV